MPTLQSSLDKLTARAEAGVWDPARDIDWSDGPARPALIPPPLYRMLVSQLYHGERATLAMCERLGREISHPGARRFLAAQAADEARHAQAYALYLDRPVYSLQMAVRRAGGLSAVESVIDKYGVDTLVLSDGKKMEKELLEYARRHYAPGEAVGTKFLFRVRPGGTDCGSARSRRPGDGARAPGAAGDWN